jgi:hypothetical protein
VYAAGLAEHVVRFRLSAGGAPNDAVTYVHALKMAPAALAAVAADAAIEEPSSRAVFNYAKM